MPQLVVEIGDDEYLVELDTETAPRTVAAVLDALPFQSNVRKWGDEIYFEAPVDAGPENAVPTVQKGDVAFWPSGNCLCLFYGKTPMSETEDEIVPASPVNPVGHMDDYDGIAEHTAGEAINVRAAD
jgi:hypothetical protein